jgi:cyclophilin family peptidyl-prolyl cis-trans isomerase
MRYLSRCFILALPALLLLAAACGSSEDTGSSDEEFATSTPDLSGETPEPTAPANCAQLPTPTQPARTPPEVQMKSYPDKPPMTIDPAKRYLAHVYTETGHVIINLRPDLAPEHVNSFVFLANDKYFDGLSFHRVIPGFVAQTGDPTGSGGGGPGYNIPLEASEVPFTKGVVGMARTNDPNSAGSQWFITLGDAPHLNGQYTVFGEVASGQEFADCIAQGDRIVELSIT